MTKQLRYVIPTLVTVAALLLTLVACSQEPIFAAIEQEIKLRDASMQNVIYSIVRKGDILYAANRKIFSKSVSSQDGWNEIASPGATIKLAASSADLYAMTINNTVYVQSGSSWNAVTGISGTVKTIIDNQASGTNASNKKAYVVTSGGVFELSGAATTGASLADASTLGAAYVSSTTCFFTSPAICSNTNNTMAYKTIGGSISYSSNGTSWTAVPVSISSPTALAYWESGSNKYLLVGTSGGYQQVSLDAGGIPTNSVANNPLANANAAIGSYEIIPGGLYSFENNIYASIISKTFPTKNGLWGYYPARGNWNRE